MEDNLPSRPLRTLTQTELDGEDYQLSGENTCLDIVTVAEQTVKEERTERTQGDQIEHFVGIV